MIQKLSFGRNFAEGKIVLELIQEYVISGTQGLF